MFGKIRYAYHLTKGEKSLEKYGECLKNGDFEEAKRLWEKASKHKQKINKKLRKMDKGSRA